MTAQPGPHPQPTEEEIAAADAAAAAQNTKAAGTTSADEAAAQISKKPVDGEPVATLFTEEELEELRKLHNALVCTQIDMANPHAGFVFATKDGREALDRKSVV